ncbi:MAG TPA: ribosome-associated translation inhibitor RaiA [Frankiaceae bacterium]|nr:ribosome-associated translation inhibitor RaiA [Frankiaceae bacterium]
MDIVVKGRRTEVSERYRAHVRDKLDRLTKLDGKAFRIDVEVCHESNPRLSGMSERIELTVYSRGPVIRAEAAAGDVYAALDLATAKLEERLRRAADRRHARQHGQGHGSGPAVPTEVRGRRRAALPVEFPADLPEVPSDSAAGAAASPGRVEPPGPVSPADEAPEPEDLGDVLMADGPLVVRQKVHEAEPMTLDEALHHMELVGHDFFLYSDSACGLPSVVYRRRGYTYGVLRLRTESFPGTAAAAPTAG